MDSPSGPLSVQPTTPAAGGELLVPKMVSQVKNYHFGFWRRKE
jgi:hypothetical protein